MDFAELRKELVDEFYYWANRPSDVFFQFQPAYWSIRGSTYIAAASHLPGTKYVLSAKTPDGLEDRIKRALMFADHVLIRHEWCIPHQAKLYMGKPCDYPGARQLRWVERHHEVVDGLPLLPHMAGCADPATTRAFLNWMCGAGRDWVREGLVTYVPGMLPQRAAADLMSKGVNVSAAFREHNVLPDDARILNHQAASAIAALRVPYLAGADAAAVAHARASDPDAFRRFRLHALALLDAVKEDPGSIEFVRALDRIAEELAEGTVALAAHLQAQESSARWRRIGVEVLALTGSVLFLVGAPAPAVIGALGAAGVGAANAMKDQISSRHEMRLNPYYALTRLGSESTQVRDWRPQLSLHPPSPGGGAAGEVTEVALDDTDDASEPAMAPSWRGIRSPDLDQGIWILCNGPAFGD